MDKTTTSKRLRQIMADRSLKQVDILRKCEPYCKLHNVKLNRNDLSQYVSGKVEPGQFKLTILAKALDVSEVWLMGYDVPMTPQTEAAPVIPSLSPDVLELARQIQQLDAEDRAEIRGEVRAMLRQDKYKEKKADVS